jgi:plasmid stabilization system protein ParE
VLAAIHRAIELVARHPESSEQTSDPDIRVKVLGRYRYKIFYRVADDTVDILHIRHAARRPW